MNPPADLSEESRPDSTAEANSSGKIEMTFLRHLEELRKCLVVSFISVGIAFVASWFFAPTIFRFLERPIKPYLPLTTSSLVFTELAAPFLVYMKVALFTGIVISSPVIMWQLWRFISPALYRREKRMALPFVFATVFFFVLGCAFGYFVAFPRVCEFFIHIGQDFTPMLTIDKYIGLLLKIILGLGLVFEMPVIVYFLVRLGVFDVFALVRWWRAVIIGCFITAAVITPTPDIATMLVFAVPMLALYALSIGVAYIAQKLPGRREET